jgi:hypothetical protein
VAWHGSCREKHRLLQKSSSSADAKADLSGGFTLMECNDLVAAYTDAAQWADLMGLAIVLMLDDAEAGPVLAARFKK